MCFCLKEKEKWAKGILNKKDDGTHREKMVEGGV